MSNAAPLAPRVAENELRRTLRGTILPLEGIRGVAILAVLGHQLCIDGYHVTGPARAGMLLFQWGWVGVQLFFVLSGFLITGILLETRAAENYWSSFFVRRALRIFPIYYLLLVGTFIIAPRVLDLSAAALAEHKNQAWYWLYIANWLPLHAEPVRTLGHCWSLSVEEQFYLVWPFIVRLLDQRGLIRLCVTVAVFALLFRIALHFTGADPELAYSLTPARADALTLGALAAIVIRRKEWIDWLAPRLPRALMVTLGLLALSGVAGGGFARINAVTQTAGYTLLAIASAFVILQATVEAAAGRGRLAAFLSSRILRSFGKYSYAIYVFHLPLHTFLAHTFITPRLAGLSQGGFLALQGAYFLLTPLLLLLLGAISYRVIEKPFLELKRFFPSRRTPA